MALNITILSKTYPPNVYCGAGVHVENMARELALFVNVDLRCFGAQNVHQGALTVTGYPPLPQIENIYDRRATSVIDGLLRSALMLKDRGAHVDLVHAHDWYTYIGGVWAKQLWGVPLVLTIHSLEPMRPWKREQVGEGGYRMSSWLEKVALAEADCIINVSDASRDDLLQHFASVRDRACVVNNGIDPSVFRPVENFAPVRQAGIDLQRTYILFVGRITRQKGIQYLLEACRFLNPNVQVVLCCGQADTPELRTETVHAFERAKANSRAALFWLDGLSGADLVPFYSHATAFCCPSVYETFSLVNLEAMACGTPVIASDIPSNRQQIRHGETGVFVPLALNGSGEAPLDPALYVQQLAASMNDLASRPSDARRLGHQASAHVLENYTWRKAAEKTVALYQEVVLRGLSAVDSPNSR